MSQIVRMPETPQPDPLPQGEGEKPSDRKLITAIKCILCLIVVGYVAFALANHIRGIDWSSVHFDLRLAGLGGIFFALVTITQIIAYRFLLSAYGQPPSWPQAATLSWVPALGKYVPGKIAALGGTVYLLRRFKISAPVALSVALMADAIAVLTGLIIAVPTLRLPEVRDKVPGGWMGCI